MYIDGQPQPFISRFSGALNQQSRWEGSPTARAGCPSTCGKMLFTPSAHGRPKDHLGTQ